MSEKRPQKDSGRDSPAAGRCVALRILMLVDEEEENGALAAEEWIKERAQGPVSAAVRIQPTVLRTAGGFH